MRAGCSIWAKYDKGLTTQNSAHGSLAQILYNPCYVRFIDISLIPSSIGGFPRYSPCIHKAIIHLVTCVNTKGSDGLQDSLPVTFGSSLIRLARWSINTSLLHRHKKQHKTDRNHRGLLCSQPYVRANNNSFMFIFSCILRFPNRKRVAGSD